MANPSELLTAVSEKRFEEIILASPKKFREEVFRKAGIRSKGNNTFSLAKSGKNSARVRKLFKALQDGFMIESEIGEEIIRNYLYTRRELLSDALDHFGVEHDNGLTDSDLDFMEEMEPAKVSALKEHLCSKHELADVELYLKFMNVEFEP